MSIIAVVDAGRASRAFYQEYFARIRRESGADTVLVITDGDLDREGNLSARDKYDRTAMFIDCGADSVVEMPMCALLLADNVYCFSVVGLLQKLNGVGQIAIPYAGGDAELFDRVAAFLFDEPMAYQKKMRSLRAQGVELRHVQADVVGEFVPGAGPWLREPMNQLAVKQYIELRKAYFPAKPLLVRLDAAPETAVHSAAQDAYVLEKLTALLQDKPDPVKWMSGMFYGDERIARRVWDIVSAGGADTFTQLSEMAERPGEPAMAIRWHLMACLTGYRKVDSYVCIIYYYIPYVRVLGTRDTAMLSRMEEIVSTTMLADTVQGRDLSRLTDSAKQLLADIDDRARELFAGEQRRQDA